MKIKLTRPVDYLVEEIHIEIKVTKVLCRKPSAATVFSESTETILTLFSIMAAYN